MTRRNVLRSGLAGLLSLWASLAAAASPTILINNGGAGSDAAASGAGPAVALSGSAAATSSTGLVVTLDGAPDLTGVATDGSHAIWLNTPSGRQFAAITAKDNTAKTVTTTTAYTVSLTGRAWAIGGKRATLDAASTRTLFTGDLASGWAIDLQEAGSSYTLTSSLICGANVSGATFGSSTTNRPTITTTVSGLAFLTGGGGGGIAGLRLQHLRFLHAGSTRGAGVYPSGGLWSNLRVSDCVFDGCSIALDGSYTTGYAFPDLAIDGTEIKNTTGPSCVTNNNGSLTVADGCDFHDNAGIVFNGTPRLIVSRCVFARNARAIVATTSTPMTVLESSFVGHTATGTNAAVDVGASALAFARCVFYGNAGYGVAGTNVTFQSANAYGGNAAGDRNGFAAGTGDTTLTADPFVNAAGNDFTPNTIAGGGALIRSIPRTPPGLVGTSYLDLGATQHRSPGRAN